ncbi:MAG: AraC family transcriptional regulator [Oscillospiraceae bacterium]|nr:AraC family transcriptional regulator [Oscillospiraceae bacterium]
MEAYQVLLNEHLEDLNPVFAGEATCLPGAINHPVKRTMLLHYVLSGKGILYLDDQQYTVCAGQAFIIPADAHAHYVADEKDPWSYRWIGFTGRLAPAFAKLPAVFDAPSDTLCHLNGQKEPHPMLAYQLSGDLLQLYAAMIQPDVLPRSHVQKAIDYIELSYMNPLAIGDIADYVGLNPFYLSKLFKEKTGHTLQSHILQVRLAEAKRYLLLGYAVKEVAAMSGFKDIANFSKLFKREFGMNPTQWRIYDLENG